MGTEAHPLEYMGAQLTMEEIITCRDRCRNMTQGPETLRQQRNKGNEYIVEFPPDDQNEQNHSPLKIDVEEENRLAIEVSQILSIKRPRSEGQEEPLNNRFWRSDNSVKKLKYRQDEDMDWAGQNENIQRNQLLLQAEEASQTLPPLAQ